MIQCISTRKVIQNINLSERAWTKIKGAHGGNDIRFFTSLEEASHIWRALGYHKKNPGHYKRTTYF
jgi:hypothetical protein